VLSDGLTGGAAVEVEHLTWRPFGRAAPILRDVSLRCAPGERVLLAGPSGSGKSTLLRAVAGLLLTADAGDLDGAVRVGGLEPQAAPGQVGLVLQDPGSGVVAASLGRDVAFGLENLGMPREQMAAPVAEALADVRLRMPPGASPASLSGGEQQRLALAGALAMSPRVLLLDEPTAMLDGDNAASVRTVVDDVLCRRGLTAIIVEHRLGPWLDLVDRIVVLDAGGAVVADGSPDAVLAGASDVLLAQGIWVPGHPDPTPLRLAVGFGRAPVAPGEVAVTARALTVRRASRPLNGPDRVTTAVQDVDLDVRAGQSLALVGPSGSGKSTLLAALGGLVPPTGGTVTLADTLGQGPPHRWPSPQLARAVAWVPQRAASTIIRRTVRDEVLATADAVGLERAVSVPRAELLLDRLGLLPLAGSDPRHLSGGEQRRLAVAAAVVHQPALILADEPTVGQDRLTWAAVVGVLDAVRAAGSGVVVSTHDDAVRDRADAVRVMTAPGAVPRGVLHRTGAALRQDRPPRTPQGEPVASVCAGPADPLRRRSLAARCAPLSLLLASLLVLPLPALLDTWQQSLVVLAVEAGLGLLALSAPGPGARPDARLRRTLLRLVPSLVGVLGVGWSAWLLGGHDVGIAAGAALRVLDLVVPSLVLLPFVDPDALGDHLAQRLHLPARPVVAATAALQRFQSFGTLWAELLLARRVRGVGAGRSLVARAKEVGATTFGLFVGVLDQAAVLALAMDARGFASAHRRSWAGRAPWGTSDTVALLGGFAVVAAGVVARLVLPG